MNKFVQNDITDEELNSITFALINRYGLDFSDYEPTSFKRRISRIMHKNNFENILQLWQKLLYDAPFATYFKDEISIGLTEMFRNPPVWEHLKNTYLKKFLSTNSLDIWHAGCSTGEEYYSMAIILKEAGLLPITKATVTDLSHHFIALTQKGEYDLDLLHKYQKNYQLINKTGNFNLYYTKNDSVGVIKDTIKPQTDFKQHNLVSDVMNKQFDIIFCRNVMIYFNETLKMKVLKLFHQALKKDGILVIGHFDALPSEYATFFNYYDPSLKIFKKQ